MSSVSSQLIDAFGWNCSKVSERSGIPPVANAGLTVYAGLMNGLLPNAKPGVCARQDVVSVALQVGTLFETSRSSLS